MEIEIKAKVKDFKAIRSGLNMIRAKRMGLKHQVDTYYLPWARKLSAGGRNSFRTRYDRISGKARLEFHHFYDLISGREDEVEVSDIKTLNKILLNLKCKKLVTVEKKRESFHYKDMEIALDRVKGLGNFIEIEINGRPGRVNEKKLMSVLSKLGVSHEQVISGPKYFSMLLAKKGKKYFYFK
ncbi:MAG: class IV adenylate cyclase [Patescibacteria group bacterium]